LRTLVPSVMTIDDSLHLFALISITKSTHHGKPSVNILSSLCFSCRTMIERGIALKPTKIGAAFVQQVHSGFK
jgi:hypothetical protein